MPGGYGTKSTPWGSSGSSSGTTAPGQSGGYNPGGSNQAAENINQQKEIEAINSAHKEELVKRDKIIDDYNKTLIQLDEEYKKQKLDLKEWEKKKVKKIVEETHNDPEGRTAKIANEFGFELVTIDDTTD